MCSKITRGCFKRLLDKMEFVCVGDMIVITIWCQKQTKHIIQSQL